MPKTSKATTADAEVILRLYDLRRETEMRKARNFMTFQFLPVTWDDVQKLAMARGTDENRYFRQACSYWDMACALVARGALNADLFFDTCGEAWFLFTKLKPYLPKMREMLNPEFLLNTEKVVTASAQGRKRVARLEERIAKMTAMAAGQK
jgi:hypothetical protein